MRGFSALFSCRAEACSTRIEPSFQCAINLDWKEHFALMASGSRHPPTNESSVGPADRRAADAGAAGKPDRSLAIVTKSYPPDLSRCELLAESLDHTAPHVPHYIIVDRRDRPAFSHLEGRKRRLIDSEALIGNWMWRTPGDRGFWLSVKALPARGWIIQQILKIAAIDVVPERTLVFCDSDVAFFRPFGLDDLLVDGKVGLLDVDFSDDRLRQWTATARRLLGVREHGPGYRNYVGHMICWNRETVREMQQRMEASTGVNWQVALARLVSFSEYMIYGTFVREVLGYGAVDHAPSSVPLVKPCWDVKFMTDAAIDKFFADFDPRTVAVMVHSKIGIDPAVYRPRLARQWNAVNGRDVSSA